MKLGRNFAAALASSVWSALLGFAVLPLYLDYLGIEAYGLIGFFATTQALFQILDLGLAPAVNRELARFSQSGAREEAQRLLHTLAVIYWSLTVLIAALMLLLAVPIADHWLSSKGLPRDALVHSVMLMGCVIACRWPVALYQAALNGMQLLTVSSGVNIAATTLAYGGAVAVLARVSPTIEAFFIWQAVVGLAHAFLMRRAAWRALGSNPSVRFALADLRRIWRFSAGMSGIALSALVFTQLDKVVLSKLLPLEEFGHYMLASSVAAALYILTTPLFNAVYPRFSALVMAGNRMPGWPSCTGSVRVCWPRCCSRPRSPWPRSPKISCSYGPAMPRSRTTLPRSSACWRSARRCMGSCTSPMRCNWPTACHAWRCRSTSRSW